MEENRSVHVGIQIPFDVYPTNVSDVRVVSPGGSRNSDSCSLGVSNSEGKFLHSSLICKSMDPIIMIIY